ncbi:MAG: superoxide dismutase family protein [Mycobacteriaceae bacterium]|nr:superoxide dismutase family protein [Mycobacteriaceae bacterium]
MASPGPRATAKSLWVAAPLLAAAVLGLAACSPPGQETSDVKGTTPAIKPAPGPGEAETHESAERSDSAKQLTATLKDAAGADVGTVTFAEAGNFVKVSVSAHGLKPGFHGLHVHQTGKCEANSAAQPGGPVGAFLSAGGHMQTGDPKAHPFSGDLPSLDVTKDGNGELVSVTDAFTLADLKVDGGRAVVVHAGPDNFGNIPNRYQASGTAGPDAETLSTGDAGARIACGVVG